MTTGEPEIEPTRRPGGMTRHAPTPGRTWRGLCWAGLSLTIFAGWFVVTRLSVTRELRVWDVAALRFGIGAVVLLPVLLAGRRRLAPRQWAEGLLYACLWGIPFVLAVAFGLQITSARRAAAITPAMMPVFAGVIAWLVWREHQGARRWCGFAAIVGGLTCLVATGVAAEGGVHPLGIGALFLAAAMWAVYTLLFRRSSLTPVQSAALICFWSALLFLPVYILGGLSRLALASTGEIALQATYQGLLMSGVAIVAFNRSVALLGPSTSTAIIALIPGAAALAAIPVLGEHPSGTETIAIAAVVLGVLLATGASARPATLSTSPTTTLPS